MAPEVPRRRFMLQTLGVIGGATVSGDLLPLLAEAAKSKQVLRVAIERDFQALKDSYAWLLGARGTAQLKVNGLPSADLIEVVDEVTVRLHLDRPVAWGLIGNALLSSSGIIHAREVLKHATA